MSPSPYVKKGYGEVSKKAEDRIREEIIIKCKECGGNMEYVKLAGSKTHGIWHCLICLRNVVVTQL